MKKILFISLLIFLIASTAFCQVRVQSQQTYEALTPTILSVYKGLSFINADTMAISSGSAVGESVTVNETIDSNQGTIELWYYPYNYGNAGQIRYLYDAYVDANNRISLYINASNNLVLDVIGAGTTRTVITSFAGIKPFTWNHIVATWSKNVDVNATNNSYVYLNGSGAGQTSATVAMASNPSSFYIGSDYNGKNSANGLMAYKIMRYWMSSAQVTANYNSGNGSLEFVARTPHTIAMGLISYDSTGVAYVHRGKSVSAIADGATEDTLTTSAGSDKAFVDNDRVIVSAGTGYSSNLLGNAFIDGTPSSTSVNVDDGVGADIGLIEKLGVFATLKGSSQYFVKITPNNIDFTTDYTVSAWIKTSSTAINKEIFQKTGSSDSGITISIPSSVLALRIYTNAGTHAIYVTVSGSKVLNDGRWHHIAITFDIAPTPTATIYVDGFVDGSSTSITGTPDTGNGYVAIGSSWINRFIGSIQDVMVWTSLLTPANILTLATNPHSENGLAPASWWVFDDEASATTIADQASAGNNNHLTLVGGTTTNYGTHSRTQSAFLTRNLFTDGDMRQGGIGALSRISGATVTKNTTTPISDEQDLKITNTGSAQGYAGQSIKTASGEDYYFYGLIKPQITPLASAKIVDVDGTSSMSQTVGQAKLIGKNLALNSQYFAVAGANTVADLTTEDCSFSFRFKMDTCQDANFRIIFNKGTVGGASYLAYRSVTGQLSFYLGGFGWGMVTTGTFQDNKWHHCAIVVDRDNQANCKIYVDGAIVTIAYDGTLASYTGSMSNAELFKIGNYTITAEARYFDGSIYDFKYWIGGVWTPTEISYQNGNQFDISGSAGTFTDKWNCTEGTGTTITGTVANLTLSNALAWNLGDVQEIEHCFEAGDTDTTIDLTVPCAVSGELAYWDNVKLVANAVNNGGCELTGTEILDETDFATHAKWDVTGDFDDSGGNAEYVWSADQTSTLIQTAVNRVSTGTNDGVYKLTYTVARTTAPDGTFTLRLIGFNESNVTINLTHTTGTHVIWFKAESDATTQDFTIQAISSGGSQGEFTIDDISLIEIGGWERDTYGVGELDTTYARAGTYGMKIGSTAGSNGVMQSLNLVVGAYYTFIAYGKVDSGDEITAFIYNDGDMNSVSWTETTMTRKRFSFKALETPTTLYIRGSGGNYGYFDDIAIIRDDEGSVTATKGAGILPMNQPALIR